MRSLTAWNLRRLDSNGFSPVTRARPGYDPAELPKLHCYGHLDRIRPSRRLEAEAHRHLKVIWLLRQLIPDFKTIKDLRRDNRGVFRAVFRQFVRLCRELDLRGRYFIAVDGTPMKAVNSRERNFTRATQKSDLRRTCERLIRHLDQMDEAETDDAGGSAVVVSDLQEKTASLHENDPGEFSLTALAYNMRQPP